MSGPLDRCGCCTGVRVSTPVDVWNRPGLPALNRRIGTHGQFLESMLARLSGTDRPELSRLTTREPDDPSIALLDGWAMIADVLTFYQERIADEGYLRTATEQDSLTRLGRLVGHRPRPALAAAAHLAYTLDPEAGSTIPAGSQVKSAPLPGALPQTFETSEDLVARAEWNRLPVRLTGPPSITPDRARAMQDLELAGIHPSIRAGDRLLFLFSVPGQRVVRTVRETRPDARNDRTAVIFESPSPAQLYGEAVARLRTAVDFAARRPPAGTVAKEIKAQVLLPLLEQGMRPQPNRFFDELAGPVRRLTEHLAVARVTGDTAVEAWLEPVVEQAGVLSAAAAAAADSPELVDLRRSADEHVGNGAAGTGQGASALVGLTPALAALDRPPSRPPTGPHDVPTSVADLYSEASDTLPRLLAAARPQLAGQLYRAMDTVSVAAPDELVEVQWLRVKATPCGATIEETEGEGRPLIEVDAPSDDQPALEGRQLTLDAVYDAILPRSWVVVQRGSGTPLVRQVMEVTQRAEVGRRVAVKVTRLQLSRRLPSDYAKADVRREITVWAAGEPLPVAERPLPDEVEGREITLDGAYEGLRPGRWLIVSGERTDVPYIAGVRGTELVMLGGVRQNHDPLRPGDRVRTTLLLTTGLAYRYRRDTVVVRGNVTPSTAGETRDEVLGSGDAGQAGQTFPLRQSPLTWLPAPTPDGAADTLTLRVGDTAWPQTEDLTDLGPADPGYRLRTGADGKAAVEFGDGRHGSRLPTGTENVTARYRIGSGRAGNVPAGQVNHVVSRPFGVSAVTNPLPATGGTDADGVESTRFRVPLRLRALDRLVSLRDYEDFARAFTGIGKAIAQHVVDGGRRIVLVTVAAVDDAPMAPASPLLAALEAALTRYGDPQLPVRVAIRDRVLLVLSAGVRVLPDRTWDTVGPAVRSALHDALGFARAGLAEPVLLSGAISAAQSVAGVDYVDVDLFTGIPDDIDTMGLKQLADQLTAAAPCVPARPAECRETRHKVVVGDTLTSVAERNGLTLDELLRLNPDIAPAVIDTELVNSVSELVVRRALRPAQLAVLDPAAPETLVLRRIP
ncbi:putative baseplate assembly protein [Streptomyces sp. ISL-11]|uniref:putative baseplate assembly protein n=1 Tax=Streptomyces sp. ISL-11 TaxID=2819174 RepID=UPI001BEBE3C9|nr:putative baseplate assembly protein [Streptomyces sp. ISL-11]MBT2382259.1 putative baseplate assembly protein [Streptomyces sp. ISL-11]